MRIIIDSREQTPFKFKDVESIVKKLDTGDYSIEGYEHEIAVERKSVPDACSSVIQGRERFQREIERGRELDYFAIVIEGTLQQLRDNIEKQFYMNHKTLKARRENYWRLSALQKTVTHTFIHWSVQYKMPVFFCKDKREAAKVTLELFKAYLKYKEK
jgi:ERCC4-type nuclease